MKQETISPHAIVPPGLAAPHILPAAPALGGTGRPENLPAMLTSVATKEQRYFADLESLVAYLQSQAPGQGETNPDAQTGKTSYSLSSTKK